MLPVPLNILMGATGKLKIVRTGIIQDFSSSFGQRWSSLVACETKSIDTRKEEKLELPWPKPFLPPPAFTLEKKRSRYWQSALWSALTQPL